MNRPVVSHTNALGGNIVLTDDNQNALIRYEYDVFGAIRSETGTSDNTRKFTGKEFDADSNLYYYGARYYDPYIGRFTQRDPIGDGVNWYAYTENNPLRFIDPDGLKRKLTPTEKAKAKDFFGDIDVNLDNVETHTRENKDFATTIYNKIYYNEDDGRIDESMLIHELVHVWQWKRGTIGFIAAGATQGWGLATDHDALYEYTLDPVGDPNRRTLSNYHFEKQAAIIEDAYRVTVLGMDPKNYLGFDGDLHSAELWTLYKLCMWEFDQWDQEFRQSSSSSNSDP